MNILFISSGLRYYDSSASTRNQQLVNELSKYANVYSVEFVHDNAKPLLNLPLRDEKLVFVKGSFRSNTDHVSAKAKRIKMLIRKIGRHLLRDSLFFVDLRTELIQAIESLESGQKFDLVITSSDPVGIHWQYLRIKSCRVAKLQCANYWQYWGDPLYGDVNHAAMPWMLFLERYLLSRSNRIFWASLTTCEDKRMTHPSLSAKMSYLPRVINVPTDLKNKISLDLHPPIKCVYAGNYFKKSRDIDPLIQAMSHLPGFSLSIIGNGETDTSVPENVEICGRKSMVESEAIVKESDIAFILANRRGTQVPGKVFELAVHPKIVVVLYEYEDNIVGFPFPKRFSFCKNDCEQIVALLRRSPIIQQHVFEEYVVGADSLKTALQEISAI